MPAVPLPQALTLPGVNAVPRRRPSLCREAGVCVLPSCVVRLFALLAECLQHATVRVLSLFGAWGQRRAPWDTASHFHFTSVS